MLGRRWRGYVAKKNGVVLESITNKDKIEAAILMITHVSIDN